MFRVSLPSECVGVELLRHRNEANVVLLEDLDYFGEVDQRPAQPVYFVNDHAVNRSGLDIADHQPTEF